MFLLLVEQKNCSHTKFRAADGIKIKATLATKKSHVDMIMILKLFRKIVNLKIACIVHQEYPSSTPIWYIVFFIFYKLSL